VLVEYARNVLGIGSAEHAETSPDADTLVVTPLSCSLVGQTHTVRILPGTRAAAVYDGRTESDESYWCNYGLNPAYRHRFEQSGLRTSAVDDEGEVRLVELDGHPFFFGTLFLPQMTSAPGTPHPLLAAFAAAVAQESVAR
jgi:CTP synthase (UTP-ammonia lyase)